MPGSIQSCGRPDAPTSLTDAVYRVLVRARTAVGAFGVFAINGQLVLSNATSVRFASLQEDYPEALLGTYGPDVTVADVLDDLRGHFFDGEGRP